MSAWTENLQARGYRPTTVKHYPRLAGQWVEFLASRNRRYDNADYDDVDAWISQKNKEGRNPWTIRASLSAIRNWYKWLKRRHYVTDNPLDSLEPVRALPHLPNPLTEAEVTAIIESEKRPLFRAMWEVFYATGARISSVIELKPEDLDLEKCRVFFKTAKRGRGSVQPLGKPAVAALRAYLEWRASELARFNGTSQWLWLGINGRPKMLEDCARDHFRRAAQKAGVKGRVYPHRLRHSTATHMLDHGANLREVQEMLVHESIQATQIYTLVSTSRLEESFCKTHPRSH